MIIKHIDHLVLTSRDITATLHFYVDILGMWRETFGEGRIAVCFGNQKINIHRAGEEIELGPVERTGALGVIESIYVRDPDGNLVELAVYKD